MNYTKLILGIILVFLLVITASAKLVAPDKWELAYKTKIIYKEIMKETCVDRIIEPNGTIHPEICYEVLDYLSPEEKQTSRVIGITNGFEIIPNAYKKGNKITMWKYDIGDRNYEEFSNCRDYEQRKGVCHEE